MIVDPQPLQNVDYVMRRTGFTKDRVWQLCRDGVIPVVKFGRRYKFDPAQLERWIARGGTAGKNAE